MPSQLGKTKRGSKVNWFDSKISDLLDAIDNDDYQSPAPEQAMHQFEREYAYGLELFESIINA